MGSRFDHTDTMAVQFVPVDNEWPTKDFRLALDRFEQLQVLKAMLPDRANRFACGTSNLTI